MVEPLRDRHTKEAATDMFNLQPPRHILTLPLHLFLDQGQHVACASKRPASQPLRKAQSRIWLIVCCLAGICPSEVSTSAVTHGRNIDSCRMPTSGSAARLPYGRPFDHHRGNGRGAADEEACQPIDAARWWNGFLMPSARKRLDEDFARPRFAEPTAMKF
jgi:hypothetical protein